jgi:hypothetical protein
MRIFALIWLLDEILIADLIDLHRLETIYRQSQYAQRRLPWDEVKKQLERLRKN